MQKILPVIVLLFSLACCAQDSKLKGAWYWNDSTRTNVISLVFKNDNIVSRYAGPEKTMHREDFKNGKYSLKKDSLLVITWDDKTIETCQINFLQKNSITLTYGSGQGAFSNRKYIFGRIFDEEVSKDKVPPEIKN